MTLHLSTQTWFSFHQEDQPTSRNFDSLRDNYALKLNLFNLLLHSSVQTVVKKRCFTAVGTRVTATIRASRLTGPNTWRHVLRTQQTSVGQEQEVDRSHPRRIQQSTNRYVQPQSTDVSVRGPLCCRESDIASGWVNRKSNLKVRFCVFFRSV